MMKSNIRNASKEEADVLVRRATSLLEVRPAASATYPEMTVDWPVPPLATRLFLGGMQLPDADDGFIDAAIFDEVLQRWAPMGAGVWSLGAEANGVFIGQQPFDAIRNWIVQDLVLSPCVMLSLDTDLIVVSDEQLNYAVLGANQAVIDYIDERFGGTAAYRKRVVEGIESGDIGFGNEGIDWAKRYLLTWCFEV